MASRGAARYGAAILSAMALLGAGAPVFAAHAHGDGCYERILSCGMAEGDTEIIGGEADHEGAYERVEADADGHVTVYMSYPALSALARSHAHSDDCYEMVLSCGQEEGTDAAASCEADDGRNDASAPAANAVEFPEDAVAFLGAVLGAAGLLFAASAI